MNPKRSIVFLIGIALTACLVWVGYWFWPSPFPMNGLREEIETSNRLTTVIALVEVIEDVDAETAPLDSEGLVKWLMEHYGGMPPETVDDSGERIVDYWGREVVVIAVEGKFFGLASRGRNGVWEDGGGDDIVVLRREKTRVTQQVGQAQ